MPSRTRILASTIAALVPLILFAAITIRTNTMANEARITADRVGLAQAAAQNVDAYLDGTLATVRALALTPDVTTAHVDGAVPPFVLQVLAENTDWTGVGIIDARGNVMIGNLGPASRVNVADRD